MVAVVRRGRGPAAAAVALRAFTALAALVLLLSADAAHAARAAAPTAPTAAAATKAAAPSATDLECSRLPGCVECALMTPEEWQAARRSWLASKTASATGVRRPAAGGGGVSGRKLLWSLAARANTTRSGGSGSPRSGGGTYVRRAGAPIKVRGHGGYGAEGLVVSAQHPGTQTPTRLTPTPTHTHTHPHPHPHPRPALSYIQCTRCAGEAYRLQEHRCICNPGYGWQLAKAVKGTPAIKQLPICKQCPAGFASGPEAPDPGSGLMYAARRMSRHGAVCVSCPSKLSNAERTKCLTSKSSSG